MTPKIAIVGLQHQGFVLAAGFAQMGYSVTALGNPDAFPPEPYLKDLIRVNVKTGRLRFVDYMPEAVRTADFVFLAQDISFDEEGVKVEPIIALADLIDSFRSSDSILCVTTQVPVGTTETLTNGSVAYIPELLRPGQSVQNFRNPDRVIIGSNEEEVLNRVASLYEPLNTDIMRMDLRSAEMAKHVHNAILATQISFTNEMEKICERVGANVDDVMRATKADSRVGQNSYLNPGWTLKNGHAIRDVRVLRTLGVETPLMDAVIAVEDNL